MKSKNVMLGLVALIFATGSAFASLTFATAAYAEVLSTSTDTTWECAQVGTCTENSAGTRCQITVPLEDNAVPSKTVNVSLSGCTTILKSISSPGDFGGQEYYDVRPKP